MIARTWFRLLRSAAAAGVCAALALPASAAPGWFPYVGELSDAMGFIDDAVDVEVKLFGSASGGEAFWSQSWSGVDVIGGLFMVNIGMGSQSPLAPALLDRDDVWLEISIDEVALAPRQRLTSNGYAQVARHARNLGGMPPSAYLTESALNTTPSRAGTTTNPPANPSPGEFWYDGSSQILYTWDAADMEWEAVTTGDLKPTNLPPNGMKVVSNGSLTNEFTNVSHLWNTGAPIQDATAFGPGAAALATVNVAEVPASYIYGLQVFTNFNLTSANNVTMTLFPPPSMQVAPIVLKNGTFSFGTYGEAWNLTNTPALEQLLFKNPAGDWTLAVVDNDNNLASGNSGNLNSLEIRYNIVRGDNLAAGGLFDVEDLFADEVLSEDDMIDGPVRTTSDEVTIEGEGVRRLQAKWFNSSNNVAANTLVPNRFIDITKRRADTTLMITYSDVIRDLNTTQKRMVWRIGAAGQDPVNHCRDADNFDVLFRTFRETANGYNWKNRGWVFFCERAPNIGDGASIPAGDYRIQLYVLDNNIEFGTSGSAGSITVEEVYLDE